MFYKFSNQHNTSVVKIKIMLIHVLGALILTI